MKRPQGFDRPPVPRVRAEVETAPAAVADRVATEPIMIVTPAPEVASAAAATTPIERPGTGDPQFSGAPPATTATSGSKRALAAAERARRRYERQEVRRFTKRSRRRRLAWAIGLGSVVVLVVGVLAAAYSPLMALREVRVEGAQRIPPAEVQAAFRDSLGTPLPLVTSAEVQRALGGFALIETYSIETIPPGTLVVRIVERAPIGVIETNDGLALVDAAGVVIERPSERPEGQPLITAAGGIAGEGFRAAGSVVRSLPAEVRSQLVAVEAATGDDVRLELAGGSAVVWGSAEESAQKAAVLSRLMVAAPPDSVSVYDVSSPANAVTR